MGLLTVLFELEPQTQKGSARSVVHEGSIVDGPMILLGFAPFIILES